MLMSDNQKRFLRKIRINRLCVMFLQIFIVISFFAIWEFLAYKGYINTFIYSSPSRILQTIRELIINNNLFNHIFKTLYEIVISFSLGGFLGIIIAIILYEFKFLAKVLEPFLILLNSMPKVALGPLIIIIAGANIKSVILMALLINLIVIVITIYNSLKNTEQTRIKLLESFRASKLQILFYLVLPNSFNTIMSSLKLNVSMTLIGVIMGEFLVSKEGIGYLIIYGTQIFNLDLVMSGIFILLIISFILYKIVTIIEKKGYKKNN